MSEQHPRLPIGPLLVMVLVLCPAPTRAQSSVSPAIVESPLNLAQILENMVQKNAERADALQKYQSKRFYTLDYAGFPAAFHAEMVVEMTYEAPGTKQFKIISQSGPQWIIDKILKRILDAEKESMTEENRERDALNSNNYDFSGLEREDAPDNCSYVVTVQPKIARKLLYRGRIWVDRKDFAVCRIEAEPAKNPSFWIKKTQIHHSYGKVGDFWLPSSNESVSSIRGGGRAVLTIQYQDYEILASHGLKDTDADTSSSSSSRINHAN